MRKSLSFLLLLLIAAGGCNILAGPAYLLFGEKERKVKAEYTGLTEKKIALVIAGRPAIEFEFPMADMDLALIAAHTIAQHVKKVAFVDQNQIDVFQRENLDWAALPMQDIGGKFQAQRVLYVDLLQFTLREENSVNLLRGNLSADIRVYDMESPNPNQPVYQTELTVIYPEVAPVPMSDSAQQATYLQTMGQFAQRLAYRFYDHKEPLRPK
jgi:hypothetical protein